MTTLTRQDILALLIQWAEQHEAIEGAHDALTELTGATPESPLVCALWKTFELYGQQLEARILGQHGKDWLTYFWAECDMGANPQDVENGVATYTLDGIEALAAMLADFAAEKEPARSPAPSA